MLLINNEDAERVLTMEQCLDALEQGIEDYYRGDAVPRPRIDVVAPCGAPNAHYMWGTMEAASKKFGVFVIRMKSDIAYFMEEQPGVQTQEKYCQKPGRFCGLIFVFSLKNAEPLAILNDGFVQHMRVAATAGLAAKHLALETASTVGMIGSGGMARTHAWAFACVRPIQRIKVYSPMREHREVYAREMETKLGIEVIPYDSPESVVRGSEIVACCTDSVIPVIKGDWLERGAVLTMVKGNWEIDDRAIERVDRFLTFAASSGKDRSPGDAEREARAFETGSHATYVAGGKEDWTWLPKRRRARPIDPAKVISLKELLEGKVAGRADPGQIFSIGGGEGIQGIQFVSVAARTLELARQHGLGRDLPTDWFLQDIRN